MELVALTVYVPKGYEVAIAAMVQSQTEAIVQAATGTEQAKLLEGRLAVTRTAAKATVLPATEAEAVTALAAIAPVEPLVEPKR